ncbi:hypothetical protein MO867_20935, partial [Microbulbifer sp. OS29]
MENEEKIIAYNGFDKDLQCRGYQYEIGKTHLHEGEVEACHSGLHACEYPLDIFSYYSPAESRFAVVEASGQIARRGDDSKIAAASLTVKAEIKLPQLIQSAVDWVISRAEKDGETAADDENQSAATNTGNRSAATNTGYQSAATNTGDQSAATNTGYQ